MWIKACSVCAIHEFLRPGRPLDPTQKRLKTQHQVHASSSGQTIFLRKTGSFIWASVKLLRLFAVFSWSTCLSEWFSTIFEQYWGMLKNNYLTLKPVLGGSRIIVAVVGDKGPQRISEAKPDNFTESQLRWHNGNTLSIVCETFVFSDIFWTQASFQLP